MISLLRPHGLWRHQQPLRLLLQQRPDRSNHTAMVELVITTKFLMDRQTDRDWGMKQQRRKVQVPLQQVVIAMIVINLIISSVSHVVHTHIFYLFFFNLVWFSLLFSRIFIAKLTTQMAGWPLSITILHWAFGYSLAVGRSLCCGCLLSLLFSDLLYIFDVFTLEIILFLWITWEKGILVLSFRALLIEITILEAFRVVFSLEMVIGV